MSTTTASPPAVGANPAPMLPYAGAAAGPLYVAIGAVEVIGQDGFDLRVHSLSLLANGSGGWIHVAMMVTTGLLTVVGAAGLARSFPGGTGARWAVRGLAVFGLGVAAAGPLRADPAFGFPPEHRTGHRRRSPGTGSATWRPGGSAFSASSWPAWRSLAGSGAAGCPAGRCSPY
jgi:Protein of unknown function (DUF998)